MQGVVYSMGMTSWPTGEVPQIVDDDDTIPDHDEELTERDIVKSLALPSLIFIQISTVESIRM